MSPGCLPWCGHVVMGRRGEQKDREIQDWCSGGALSLGMGVDSAEFEGREGLEKSLES